MYTLRKTFKFGSLEDSWSKCTLGNSTYSIIRIVWSNAFKSIFTLVKVTKSIQQGNVEGKSQVRLRQKLKTVNSDVKLDAYVQIQMYFHTDMTLQK